MSATLQDPREWAMRALESNKRTLPEDIDRNELQEAIWHLEEEGPGELTADETDVINRVLAYQAKDQASDTDHEARPERAQEPVGPATEPGHVKLEATEGGTETGVNENASQSQPEAETIKSEVTEQPQPSLVDQFAATLGPPKKAGSLEEELQWPIPSDWQERFTDWNSWIGIPTGKPSLEEIPYKLKVSTKAEDKREHAVRTWVKEASRTYYFKEKFWYLTNTGRWYPYPKTDILNILEGTDLFHNRPPGREAGAAWQREKTNTFLRRVQTQNAADFVGELAGYHAGLESHKKRTYLITNGPELVEPVPGSCDSIVGTLHEVLGEDQTEYLLSWLTAADKCLRTEDRSSGQMLIVGGKKDSGKTFIKEHIIRKALGGRHADPSEYLKGGRFNSDVFKAESWEIDDGVGTKEKRQVMTGAVKKTTATSEHRLEGKYADGIQPPPVFLRIHAYVNTDDESDLFAIPEITDSIRDKLIILHASQSKHERPTTILPDANVEGAREAAVEKINSEFPAFIHSLRTRKTPEKYRSARYGSAPYINPDLEKVLHKASDEGKLLDLIDKLVFTYNKIAEPWEGMASELDLALSRSARDANQMKDYERVKWKGDAIGTGLAALAKEPGSRVTKRARHGDARGWIIQPPAGHREYMAEKEEKAGKRSNRPTIDYSASE